MNIAVKKYQFVLSGFTEKGLHGFELLGLKTLTARFDRLNQGCPSWLHWRRCVWIVDMDMCVCLSAHPVRGGTDGLTESFYAESLSWQNPVLSRHRVTQIGSAAKGLG